MSVLSATLHDEVVACIDLAARGDFTGRQWLHLGGDELLIHNRVNTHTHTHTNTPCSQCHVELYALCIHSMCIKACVVVDYNSIIFFIILQYTCIYRAHIHSDVLYIRTYI